VVVFLSLVIAVAGLISTILGVGALPRWIRRTQLWINERDRRRLLNSLRDLDGKIERGVRQPLVANDYMFGRLWGLFALKRRSAPIYDAINQRYRTSLGLKPYSLQETPGMLSATRINRSYDEAREQIKQNHRTRGVRDMSKLTVGFGVIAFVAAIAIPFVT